MSKLPQKFLSRMAIDEETGCWIWTGGKRIGKHGKGLTYGKFYVGHYKHVQAHRFSYETLIGPIPEGLEPDHLCRNSLCVNPSHIELVTHSLNVLRGNCPKLNVLRHLAMDHCRNGHEYTPENTHIYQGKRYCRTCKRLAYRAWYWRHHGKE